MASSAIRRPDESQTLEAVQFPRVSGFTIIRKVYDGSVSTVYKARQDRLGRTVALKLLPELPAPSDVHLQRFNRSAHVGAQVIDRNIPVLYETGTKDGFHYTISQYVRGWTLQDLIEHRKRLSERRSVLVAIQVAKALEALHAKRIYHRNLKPKNILVRLDGHTYLVGLGLAKCEAACFSKHLDAHTIGTPHFMAPELVRGKECNAQTDLYALGITMYVMATGVPPFPKGVPAAVMAQHVYKDAPSLTEIRPDFSPGYAALVSRLLAKRPEDRPGSARETINQLDRLLDGMTDQNGHIRSKALEVKSYYQPLKSRIAGDAAGFALGLGLVMLFGMAMIGVGYSFWPSERTSPIETPPIEKPAPVVEETETQAATPLTILPARRNLVAPEITRAYQRLRELEGVFRRDHARGIREWEAFLRHYPEAPADLRREAHESILTCRRLALEQAEGTRQRLEPNRADDQLDF